MNFTEFMLNENLQKGIDEYAKTHTSAMRTVFKDGKMHNRETFTTIRERLANEKD